MLPAEKSKKLLTRSDRARNAAAARHAKAVSEIVRNFDSFRDTISDQLLQTNDEGRNGYNRVAAALISEAEKGNVRAIDLLLELTGDKQPQTVELKTEYNAVSVEEMKLQYNKILNEIGLC